MSKTNIFFSRFEGTRGERNQIFRTLVPAVSGSTTTITKNDTITNANNIDENANDVQTNEAGKKPQLSAEVSFEENHVRIVFQRGMSIHVVEVPFPEI